MIWVIGGTKDSREIVEILLINDHRVLVTTATSYAANLLKIHENLTLEVGRKTEEEMHQLIEEYGIHLIIDASHPYAEVVSRNCIRVSTSKQIELLCYERPRSTHSSGKYFKSYKEILQYVTARTGNILLTIGSNNLDIFAKEEILSRVIARVLPTPYVIEKCKSLGLKPNQIIAMQGPFSYSLNRELIKFYDIRFLVTKDTGTVGGFTHKIDSIRDAGGEALILKRPEIKYKKIYYTYEELVKKVEEIR